MKLPKEYQILGEFRVFRAPLFGRFGYLLYICFCNPEKTTDMKKIFPLLLLLLSAVNFVACDIYIDDPYGYDHSYDRPSDRARAAVISGQWRGDFGMFYSARHPYTGEWQRFEADESYVVFYSNGYAARSGKGKQIDFYRSGPYEYQYHAFYWELRNGVLYLDYPHDRNLNVEIYDYSLTAYDFRGRINGSNFVFHLSKLVNWNQWHRYTGDYMFGEAPSAPGYYAPARQAGELPLNESADAKAWSIRNGRRSSNQEKTD